jgi:hypothetical protein
MWGLHAYVALCCWWICRLSRAGICQGFACALMDALDPDTSQLCQLLWLQPLTAREKGCSNAASAVPASNTSPVPQGVAAAEAGLGQCTWCCEEMTQTQQPHVISSCT